MRTKQVKRMVRNMSNENLIKECQEQFTLSLNEKTQTAIGWALLITGSIIPVFCFILWPLALLVFLGKGRKHTRISKIMIKELQKRGYKCITKVGLGVNKQELHIIRNRW